MNIANQEWFDICNVDDILQNMGRCALFNEQQVAIFRIKNKSGQEQFYAIDNYCPFSKSNTISRGLTGSIADKVVVASPIYKQHFELSTGLCLEDENVSLKTYPVRLSGNTIQLAV
jgi:nitrite reductase (NADH) small subunit